MSFFNDLQFRDRAVYIMLPNKQLNARVCHTFETHRDCFHLEKPTKVLLTVTKDIY